MATTNPYFEQISRIKPSCILFLVDQSGSMADPFGGVLDGVANPSKAQGAADALNRCLSNIAIRCAHDAGYRNYFDIGVWGYGSSTGPALDGVLAGRELIPVADLANAPLRIEDRLQQVPDGAGGLVTQTIKFEVWVDPAAAGMTPMCQTLLQAKAAVKSWMETHQDSYPPTIINITDGASTDGDPRAAAKEITELANANGSRALLFNVHICDSRVPPILYPATSDLLTDDYARQLYEMSSPLPEKLVVEASAGGLPVAKGSRGFVFNGGLAALIRFLDIGTRMSTMTDMRPGQ